MSFAQMVIQHARLSIREACNFLRTQKPAFVAAGEKVLRFIENHESYGYLDTPYQVWARSNSKLGKILSFGVLPVLTCNRNAPCAFGSHRCYSLKAFRHAHYIGRMLQNLLLVQLERGHQVIAAEFYQIMGRYGAPTHVRLYTDGDVWTPAIARFWYKLALYYPEVQFLAYTKSPEIWHAAHVQWSHDGFRTPRNLHIRVSSPVNIPPAMVGSTIDGGHYIVTDNPAELECAQFLCTGHCEDCLKCWNPDIRTIANRPH